MSVPTYIFTLSSEANDESIQALVSVAEISIGLKTMKDYADYLLTKNKSLISSRFTRKGATTVYWDGDLAIVTQTLREILASRIQDMSIFLTIGGKTRMENTKSFLQKDSSCGETRYSSRGTRSSRAPSGETSARKI
jgi:hypothetical protein